MTAAPACATCGHHAAHHTTRNHRLPSGVVEKTPGSCCVYNSDWCPCVKYINPIEPEMPDPVLPLSPNVVPGTGQLDPKYPGWERFDVITWRRIT